MLTRSLEVAVLYNILVALVAPAVLAALVAIFTRNIALALQVGALLFCVVLVGLVYKFAFILGR